MGLFSRDADWCFTTFTSSLSKFCSLCWSLSILTFDQSLLCSCYSDSCSLVFAWILWGCMHLFCSTSKFSASEKLNYSLMSLYSFPFSSTDHDLLDMGSFWRALTLDSSLFSVFLPLEAVSGQLYFALQTWWKDFRGFECRTLLRTRLKFIFKTQTLAKVSRICSWMGVSSICLRFTKNDQSKESRRDN